MSNQRRKSSRRRRRRIQRLQHTALIALCAILALILAIMIFVTVYVEHLYGKINHVPDSSQGTISSEELDNLYQTESMDPDFTGPVVNATEITWDTAPTLPDVEDENYVNILLVGQDRRWNESRGRSDAMVLCTFDKRNNTITMSSFMRDMYVQIPGYKDNRINAAYALGGIPLLKETFAVNFGVRIDGCVEVSFFNFPEIIDTLGGLELTLTQAEADFLNANGNWGLGPEGSDWTLTEGVNLMTGEQSLAYSRLRGIDDDFHRTVRQQNVLNALIGKVKDQSIFDLLALMETFLPMITTDMDQQELTQHAINFLPMLTSAEMKSQRVPAWGYYENAVLDNGWQVLLPNLEKIRQLLTDTLQPPTG